MKTEWVFSVPAGYGMHVPGLGNVIKVEAEDETEAKEKAVALLADEQKEFECRFAGK